jgi:hypothetical protein
MCNVVTDDKFSLAIVVSSQLKVMCLEEARLREGLKRKWRIKCSFKTLINKFPSNQSAVQATRADYDQVMRRGDWNWPLA